MLFDSDRVDDELIVSKPDCLHYYKLNQRPDSVKSSPIDSTNSSSEFGSTEHRATCHRCGNMRKSVLRCGKCPYVFCNRCTDKMIEEHGCDIFENGCPVCKGVCCCGMNKTMDCNRKYHCYKKCPTTRTPPTKNNGHSHSSRSTHRCASVRIAKSEEEEEKVLDLSSCHEIPTHVSYPNQQETYQWSSAYKSPPEERKQHSNGTRKRPTPQAQASAHEPRPNDSSGNFEYDSVDKTKLKNILDDAMKSFSSILSPTSLMPEVNPFFLQCPLGYIGNMGQKVGKLPSIDSLPYTKQGFYKDHNGILFPVDKPLEYYLPVFHNKEYLNPKANNEVPVDEHKNGSRAEEYRKIISKNDELIERLLQQERSNGIQSEKPSTTFFNNHSPPSNASSDPVQFCREWLQHHVDSKEAHTPRTPSSNPSATSQLGKQFHYSLHQNGDANKPASEQKDPSSPIPFDSLFSDVPNVPGTKYSQGDSIAAYMNLGIMTPGLTPMILSHITANESAYLENHGLMNDHLDDFLPEDLFACHTPANARDICDGLRASDPFHFTPFLTSSSMDTYHDQQGRDDQESSFSLNNIDCTPILNRDQLRFNGRSSTLRKSKPDAPHDTLSTQPLNTTHATDSSQFSYHGNPESLALICTELYTKILSDEIDCDDIQPQPHQGNRTTGEAVTEVSMGRIPDTRPDDRNNKRKRIGQTEEDDQKKEEEEKVVGKGQLEGFDDRIFEKDEPQFQSTP
eukprot:gene32057-41574_t